MENQKRKKCICIVGMHRSGTSTMAGLLHAVGFDLGRNVYPPRYDNPKGFFENIPLNLLNDKILNLGNGAWHSTCLMEEGGNDPETVESLVSEACNIIRDEFRMTEDIVIKDPRMSVLIPFYLRVFRLLDLDPCFLVCFRNPADVAESLKQRDNMPYSRSEVLWVDYNLKIEKFTRESPRIFINFREVISGPVKTLEAVMMKFGFPENVMNDSKERLGGFIDPSLDHSSANVEDPLRTDLAGRLFTILNRAGIKEGFISWRNEMDRISGEFRRQLLFYHGLPAERETLVQFISGPRKLESFRCQTAQRRNHLLFNKDFVEKVTRIIIKPANMRARICLSDLIILDSEDSRITPDRILTNAEGQDDRMNYVFSTPVPEIMLVFDRPFAFKQIEFDLLFQPPLFINNI